MEPRIPDGSLCLFHGPVTGTRQDRIVLAEHRSISDPETGGSYTVKRYRSEKRRAGDGDGDQASVRLEPLNPDYEPIVLEGIAEDEVRVVAELVEVLSKE